MAEAGAELTAARTSIQSAAASRLIFLDILVSFWSWAQVVLRAVSMAALSSQCLREGF
jgi:hypothetical protein